MRYLNKLLFFSILLAIYSIFIYFSDNTVAENNIMIVHYINVGQGDAALIQVNNKTLLIDSGPTSNRQDIINYLDKINLKKLDYIIATHPHEDHIGNMATIIKKYKVYNFYAPKITSNSISFENMIGALSDKNLKVNILNNTTNSIDLGSNTAFNIFSPEPNFTTDNINNYSPIFKISFNDTSFLFTGDAELECESFVLAKGYNIQSDVIKIGHHGSSTSSSNEFITAVNPDLAIISVGKNNEYGHPTSQTLSTLSLNKVTVYRTDIDNHIVLASNGKNIIKIEN